MDGAYSKKLPESNVFCDLAYRTLVDYLCLDSLVEYIINRNLKVSVRDLSFKILAKYWPLDSHHIISSNETRILNEVRSSLMLKYGLAYQARDHEIIQILNYAEDRGLEIKLFAAIKKSVNDLNSLLNEKIMVDDKLVYWKSYLSGNWNCTGPFYKLKSNNILEVDNHWAEYIRQNEEGIKSIISSRIATLLMGETIKVRSYEGKGSNEKRGFQELDRMENLMLMQLKLNKKEYSCLEEAFAWAKVSFKKYEKLQTLYLAYCNEFNVRKGAQKYPLVTSLLLIYTAVYRYNEEDSNGFWPEFFNGHDTYNFVRDVDPVMTALEWVTSSYSIDAKDRHYLSKINLSKIFAQIYLPEVSLRRLYSALYSYYFKNNRGYKVFNLDDFLEFNSYRLDKPGLFFINMDMVIEDAFDKLIDLLNEGINDIRSIETISNIPERFIETFRIWYHKEKPQIDSKKEDYYIDNPRIKFDIANEKIILYLPHQKSRVNSYEESGWSIKIDKSKSFIDGRIVRQSGGAYLILDEEIELGYFKTIEIEYKFNNKIRVSKDTFQ